MKEFGNVVVAMVKELRLLERLADANAASDEDKDRILEIESNLEDVKCPF